MLTLKGGRFVINKPIQPSKIESTDEITEIKVVSPEPDKLFEKRPIPELHETIQKVDIPCLVEDSHSDS